jgi:hypothetical protein
MRHGEVVTLCLCLCLHSLRPRHRHCGQHQGAAVLEPIGNDRSRPSPDLRTHRPGDNSIALRCLVGKRPEKSQSDAALERRRRWQPGRNSSSTTPGSKLLCELGRKRSRCQRKRSINQRHRSCSWCELPARIPGIHDGWLPRNTPTSTPTLLLEHEDPTRRGVPGGRFRRVRNSDSRCNERVRPAANLERLERDRLLEERLVPAIK